MGEPCGVLSVYSILQSLALSALDAQGAESAPKRVESTKVSGTRKCTLKSEGTVASNGLILIDCL